MTGPLRLSDIKTSVYGGVHFDRNIDVGWAFSPSIGLVVKKIDLLALQLETFGVPLRLAAEFMGKSFEKNFKEGGRPQHWRELSAYTKKVRGKGKGGGGKVPILIRTGALMNAVTSFSIWSFGPKSMSIKELPEHVWYGNVHQSGYGSLLHAAKKDLGPGASAKAIRARVMHLAKVGRPPSQQTKVVIPQRQFVLFQVDDIEAIHEIFIKWMEERALEFGRGVI